MKKVDTSRFSHDECWGIQINGLNHCKNINCRWQGLTACEGKEIIRTGKNSMGYPTLSADRTKWYQYN